MRSAPREDRPRKGPRPARIVVVNLMLGALLLSLLLQLAVLATYGEAG